MLPKNLKKFAISLTIGSGIGILISAMLIFLLAAVLSTADIPVLLLSPLTVIILAVGAFCGGFLSSKFFEEKGLICGMFSGIIFFLIIWITGTAFENSGFGTAAAIKVFMLIISASLGGIFGVNFKRK